MLLLPFLSRLSLLCHCKYGPYSSDVTIMYYLQIFAILRLR